MESLHEYADQLFGREDTMLASMREEAVKRGFPAIQVPQELGRLLQLLLIELHAMRVLEIGTLFGYSSILMARAMPAGGRITTLEVNPKHAALARENFDQAGVSDKIRVLEGNAVQSLATLQGDLFDLVFIDADKASYPTYLESALRVTQVGSIIVADNVWRDGAVLRPQSDDEDNKGMARFNQDLAGNPRLTATIIPTRNCSDAAAVAVVVADP